MIWYLADCDYRQHCIPVSRGVLLLQRESCLLAEVAFIWASLPKQHCTWRKFEHRQYSAAKAVELSRPSDALVPYCMLSQQDAP